MKNRLAPLVFKAGLPAAGSLNIVRSSLGKTIPGRCFGLKEHVRLDRLLARPELKLVVAGTGKTVLRYSMSLYLAPFSHRQRLV
jgi:hypothetical protein